MATMVRKKDFEETEFGELVESGERPDYTVQDALGTISGYTDYPPQEMRVVNIWKEVLAEVYKRNGFTAMEPRPVEYAMNLQKTGGLDKQIYGISRLQDASVTKIGLPFDRTVPMAIMIAKFANMIKFPYARYDIGWSWRGEHATKGRYRAFIQADVDIIDRLLTSVSDAQCIVAIIQGLGALGVPKPRVYLNHIGVAKSFLKIANIPEEKHKDALRAIDKLKDDNKEEVVKELCNNVPGFPEEQARILLDKMNYRGELKNFEFPDNPDKETIDAFNHLKEIERIAIGMEIEEGTLLFAPNLTRGLDYYTGVVFESFIPGKEKLGSVASGGRYDNLVGEFNENVKLQGVGGSIGLTRLFDVMKALNLVDLSKQTTAQIFVGYRTKSELATAVGLATALRKQGAYVELHSSDLKVKKQLTLADAKGIPLAAMVMNADEIITKNLRVKKESEGRTDQLTFDSIEAATKSICESLSQVQKLEKSFQEPTELKVED